MTNKKKRVPEKLLFSIYIIFTITLLLGAVLFSVGRDKGYRIKGLSIQKTSTVEMTISEPETWIFVGETPVYKTSSERENISIPNIEPRQQLVTVIKDSYFPWAKKLEIPSNSNLTLYPFLLKQDVQAELVTLGNDDFYKLSQYFFNPENTVQTSYETTEHRISATESGVSIECIEEKCYIPPINLEVPTTSVYTFRNNQNVVIYTTSKEIWISELVADLRISYKIFEGGNIRMFSEEDTLLVQSFGSFYRINL